MSREPMHAGEVEIDIGLVTELISAQFPEWSGLPLTRFPSAGTVNAIFRLGSEMAVRLPRVEQYAWKPGKLEEHHAWLQTLAPQLAGAIPSPLGVGQPGAGYPFTWAVHIWLEGENPRPAVDGNSEALAEDLASFVASLHAAPAAGAPESKWRTDWLEREDAGMRTLITGLGDVIDPDVAIQVWDQALRVPSWKGPTVLTHADLIPGNLLVRNARLAAVIDFEGAGVGDPAVDLMPAWAVLSGKGRKAFLAALQPDDATWARGRAAALTKAYGIAYYRTSNSEFSEMATRTVQEVIAEFKTGR